MNDQTIRIAQVLAGAERGGAENFFVRLVKGLNRRPECQQKAFIRDHAHRVEDLRGAGVTTQGFSFGGRLDYFGRAKYHRSLKDYNPDIVLTWMNRASGSTPAGKYILINRLGHYYNLKYYRHADYWIGISKGICKHLIDGGMPKEKVFHIPNFADEKPVKPLPRDSYNTPLDKPLILAAGRLHVNKGFDILLKSLVNIPDATLWLAGSGPEEDSLKALCSKLGLNSRVKFLGWRDDVTALMRTADVFVCPSRHEGLGSIVMESWAHRCPIIATRSQGPGEVIEDGYSGLLTDIDDVNQLTQAITSLLSDDTLKQQLIENASKVYAEGYSEDYIVSEYIRLFSLIKANKNFK
ncbi:glycosyltransferase [Alkalimarinus alittae]|uniref:Glycosyltransferase n=1 Tax=Alkalimarinus alittae TaxID=2961619 RepID=A0ABY6N100_9ALTE|nr:glycosyltransferase [Alkalimarinus alittae]UZE95759.1 glycosyltransferase [Alkalimarinus alittae]